MLKFLDNRTQEVIRKSPKKYQPQMLYGNSFEAPKQFQNNHTIFQKTSYLNPYLNYQQERKKQIPQDFKISVQPQWRTKVDLHSIQEHKILSSEPQLHGRKIDFKSRYLDNYYEQYNKHHGRFRKSKGEFTDFIQKNHQMKSLWPLHGKERNENRIQQTKKSVWFARQNKRSNYSVSYYDTTNGDDKQKLIRQVRHSTDLINTVASGGTSIGKNSQLITEKQRIRRNRQLLNESYRKSLHKAKQGHKNKFIFELPRVGPQHEITILQKKSFYI